MIGQRDHEALVNLRKMIRLKAVHENHADALTLVNDGDTHFRSNIAQPTYPEIRGSVYIAKPRDVAGTQHMPDGSSLTRQWQRYLRQVAGLRVTLDVAHGIGASHQCAACGSSPGYVQRGVKNIVDNRVQVQQP